MRFSAFMRMISTLLWLKFGWNTIVVILSSLGVVTIFYIWFRDIERERRFQGNHTSLVQASFKWGLIWFLFREVWFFFRIFWRFFHTRISPLTASWWSWPLYGIHVIPPFQVPLLNTIILLIRGLTATLAHHELLSRTNTAWVWVRIGLGIYFLSLQYMEYKTSSYSISSRVYGRIFFFGTGFHGIHVCLGVTILFVRGLRVEKHLLTSQHHFGLEFRLWYWHFVDVVWLFLFFWIYTWGI